jgi:CubicO group peptidase (beta-lactamase class C family)
MMLVVGLTGCQFIPGGKALPVQSDAVSDQIPWASGKWRTSTPEEQGMDSAQLAGVLENIRMQMKSNLHSLVVVRNGYMVMSAYFGGHHAEEQALYPVHSVTKSVVSALTGIAIEDGLLEGTGQKVLDFFPDEKLLQTDSNKAAMTVKDLLTMQSGL